jgi:exosortase
VAVALLALYLPVLGHAVDVWRSDQEFSFGFLVPPAVLLMVALRWQALARSPARPRDLGLVAMLVGLLTFLVGTRSGVHALAAVSLLPAALGAVTYLYGVAPARLAAFPLALLTTGLSVYRGVLAPLGFALQQLTAQLSADTASLVVPVRRSGVDLFTGNVHLVVAEACNGMDSLLALLCLGALFVGLVRASAARRLLLMALVVPIALAANVLRVTLVLVLSHPFGLAVAQGTLHQLLSASLFAGAALLFFAVGLVLRCTPSFEFAATPSSSF